MIDVVDRTKREGTHPSNICFHQETNIYKQTRYIFYYKKTMIKQNNTIWLQVFFSGFSFCRPPPTWMTLAKNLSTMDRSKLPHSTCQCSPFSKLVMSIQLPKIGRWSSGMVRPWVVVILRTLRVPKVAMRWIFAAKERPVSVGRMSIHTRCSSFTDRTVI